MPTPLAGHGGDMTESAPQRASDVDQPDGGGPSRDAEGTGRTPHPDQPAEGPDDASAVDPEDRVTGV
ncbi:hypothetical protein [Modestobacter sp. DSM 44400]|uniref:hypothetical protein n=1 Tax=Modestobacter sp. DSM 44400 TaxID=1550230 RepID=UPI001115440F|nr:hypothetical protein [Modestobacter sp. DSM 44400]